MNLGAQAEKLNTAQAYSAIDRVVVTTQDATYRSPADGFDDLTGYILECPSDYASQEVADHILEMVEGIEYQPYAADGASMDPCGELGDDITIYGTESRLYAIESYCDDRYASDISAPFTDDLEHEYPSLTGAERAITRAEQKNNALIKVTKTEIVQSVQTVSENLNSISSTLTQTADSLTLAIERTASNAQDALDAYADTQRKIIKADENGITIGDPDTGSYVNLDTGDLEFYVANNMVASFGTDDATIEKVNVGTGLSIGGSWEFINRANGHLTLKRRTQ